MPPGSASAPGQLAGKATPLLNQGQGRRIFLHMVCVTTGRCSVSRPLVVLADVGATQPARFPGEGGSRGESVHQGSALCGATSFPILCGTEGFPGLGGFRYKNQNSPVETGIAGPCGLIFRTILEPSVSPWA